MILFVRMRENAKYKSGNNQTTEPERSGACNARPIAIGPQRVTEAE